MTSGSQFGEGGSIGSGDGTRGANPDFSVPEAGGTAPIEHEHREQKWADEARRMYETECASERVTEQVTARAVPLETRAPVRLETPEMDAASLERFVGGRLFAVLGSVAMTVGVGLFLKLAWDRGWIAAVPGEVKCVAGGLLGAALVAVGEGGRKKIGVWAAMGLSSAGLAAMYAAAYASWGVYGLVDSAAAFGLLAVIAGAGVALALRAKAPALAVLSTVLAYVAPPVLSEANSSPVVLPVYLLAVAAMGLILSARFGGAWRVLRPVTWWGTALLGAAWLWERGSGEPLVALGFLAVAWAAFQAEIGVGAAVRDEDEARPTRLGACWALRPMVSSVTTTILVVLGGSLVLDRSGAAPTALAPAFVSVATFVAWRLLGGRTAKLNSVPELARDRMAVTMVAQSGALAAAAMSLSLVGGGETFAWLVMGIGVLLAGRFTGLRALAWYGLGAMGVATGRLLTWDLFFMPQDVALFTVGTIDVSVWVTLMALSGVAWIVAAVLVDDSQRSEREEALLPRHASSAMAFVGIFLFGAGSFGLSKTPEAAALMLSVVAGVSFALRLTLRRLRTDWAGIAWLGVALVALIFALAPYEPETWRTFGVVSVPALAAMVWSAVCLAPALVCRRVGGDDNERALALIAGVAGVVGLWLTGSAELARVAMERFGDDAAHPVLTVWWALYGVALVASGAVLRERGLRLGGLGLMALAAAKVLVIDLADADPVFRVAAFIGLGFAMLGVAVGYGRVMTLAGLSEKKPGGGEGSGRKLHHAAR